MADEPTFIAALRQIATHPAARGLADDCAVLELGAETLVLSHDMMAEGVHFLPEQDPADVAWKLLTSNLSDLAAKGAQPLGVLLGYVLGDDDARFIAGLKQALDTYAVPLLGGDTIAAPARVYGLTAIGRATHRPVPSRSGAQIGDALYITGAVGAAMLGLEALRVGTGDSTAYRRPVALLAEGQALAPHVTAMMDVSDGLLLDAARMAEASQLSFAITSGTIPIATAEVRRDEALRWGDDYQLLFTADPTIQLPIASFRIGEATAKCAASVVLDGVALHQTAKMGYVHR